MVHHYLKTLGPLGASILGFEQRATTFAGLRHQEPAVIGSQPSPQPEPFFLKVASYAGQMCSAGDVNFVSSLTGSRFLPLVTPRGNCFSQAKPTAACDV